MSLINCCILCNWWGLQQQQDKLCEYCLNEFFQETYCYNAGYDLTQPIQRGQCVCSQGQTKPLFKTQFNGSHCDIPGSVWKVPGRLEAGGEIFISFMYMLMLML